jgi:arylsulfatase A-like enzyme
VRPHHGVRDARWKYIRWNLEPQEEELYDLQADPDELHSLAGSPQHAPELERLRRRLAELRQQYDDHDPPGYAPQPQKAAHCPA